MLTLDQVDSSKTGKGGTDPGRERGLWEVSMTFNRLILKGCQMKHFSVTAEHCHLVSQQSWTSNPTVCMKENHHKLHNSNYVGHTEVPERQWQTLAMAWMTVNKLRLNPRKMEVLLLELDSVPGEDSDLRLDRVVLSRKEPVHSLLPDKQWQL